MGAPTQLGDFLWGSAAVCWLLQVGSDSLGGVWGGWDVCGVEGGDGDKGSPAGEDDGVGARDKAHSGFQGGAGVGGQCGGEADIHRGADYGAGADYCPMCFLPVVLLATVHLSPAVQNEL